MTYRWTTYTYDAHKTSNDNPTGGWDLGTTDATTRWWERWTPPKILTEAEKRRRAGENPRAKVGKILWEMIKNIVE